jgi:hypothetical protein
MANSKGDARGVSTLMATLMTVVVLLVLGAFLCLMVVDVTPSGIPTMGALECTRNASDNYTFKVITLTNSAIPRDQVSVVIHPDNSTIHASNITGYGEYLRQGDTFTVGNLYPGTQYTVLIEYKTTGSVIASLTISPYL